jgi:hypothetical protein
MSLSAENTPYTDRRNCKMIERSNAVESDPTTRPDGLWKIVLGVVCGLILAYGALYSKNKVGDVAFLVGENTVYALFIFGVFRLISGRKTGRLNGFVFVAIVASLVAANLMGYSHQNASMDRSVARVSQGMSSIVDSSVDAQGNPKIINTVLDTKKIEAGEAGEEERFAKTYLNSVVALRNDFVGGMLALGWPDTIMGPNRVAKDTGLVQSFAKLDKADGLLQTFKSKMHALQASARQEINTLAVEESTKTKMRKSFDEGLRLSPTEALIDIQAKGLTEYRAIFQLLKDTQGRWAVNKGKFDFQREQDLIAFQAHAEAIDKSMEQGQALETASAAAAQATIKGAGSPP